MAGKFVEEAIDVLDVAGVPAGEFEQSAVRHGRHQVVHDSSVLFGGIGPFYGEYRYVEGAQPLQ